LRTDAPGLLAALALVTSACGAPDPETERPLWRRIDGADFAKAELQREHTGCLAEKGTPDQHDGNAMAHWVIDFADCMRERGWEQTSP